MDRITSTRVDDDDRLRLPPIPPPQSSGTEKKESQDRHHNQACRPSGKRSSTSSHDLHPDDVLTVTSSLQISRSLKCQSSARCWSPLEDRAATSRWTLCGAMFAMQSYSRIMRGPACSERGCANHAMGAWTA